MLSLIWIKRKYFALIQCHSSLYIDFRVGAWWGWWGGGVGVVGGGKSGRVVVGVAQLAEALPDKQEVRKFDSLWGHCDFSGPTVALESIPRVSPGGKGNRCVELTTLSPLRTDWLEILKTLTCWSPQGLSRVCPGPVQGLSRVGPGPVQGLLYFTLNELQIFCSFVCTRFWSTIATV